MASRSSKRRERRLGTWRPSPWNWLLGTVLAQATAASWEVDHFLEEEGMFLSDAAKTRLPELARQFHLLSNRLSREALAEVPVVKEWKMSPKVHLFIHLMEWQVTEVGLTSWLLGHWVGTKVEVSRS